MPSSRIRACGTQRLARLLPGLLLLLDTSCVLPGAAKPLPGRRDYQERTLVAVPGGHLQLAGGNLMLRRVDHVVDTLLGGFELGAVYNSADGRWLWSFDVHYDGMRFVDGSGAVIGVGGVPFGAAIPGTTWVRLDARRIQSKGGLVYEFDPISGRLVVIRRALPGSPKLLHHVQSVSGGVRVVRISQCFSEQDCEDVYRLGYDEHGCVGRVEDRAGRVSLFEHDVDCRLLSARDALDIEQGWPGWRYEYSGSLLRAVTNSEAERVEYDYLDGRLVEARAIGAEQPTMRFGYGIDPGDHVHFTRVEDARGGWSSWRYDVGGRLLSVRNATGDVTRLAWQGLRPIQVRDPAGATTLYEYAGDDPVRIQLPAGNVVEIEYAAGGLNHAAPHRRPIRLVRDRLGTIEERRYGADGQLESVTNGAGETTRFVFDARGMLVFLTDPMGITTAFDLHGVHGHATRIVQGGVALERVYDAVGNLLEGGSPEDPAPPGAGRRHYDADRSLIAVDLHGGSEVDPFGDEVARLEIERRSDGRATRIRRPYGGESELVYDALGRLAARREKVDGVWQETRFAFDRAGALVAMELPNGMRREIDYDASGREVAVRLLRDGVVEQSLVQEWRRGLLVARRDSSHAASERLTYDGAGRVVAIDYPGGEVLELGYDLRSREVLRRYLPAAGAPPLRTIGFGYDGADRRIRVLDEGEPVLEHEIRDGRTAWIHYGNGLTRRFEYDPDFGLLARSDTYRVGLGFLERTTVQRLPCEADRLCIEIRSVLDEDTGGVLYGAASERYRLAPLPGSQPVSSAGLLPGGRLEYWEVSAASDAGSLVLGRNIAFDLVGNQLGTGFGPTLDARFEYNAERNRLRAAEDGARREYVWDEAGYLVSRGGVPLVWDAGGRLAALGDEIELGWDVQGRLLRSRLAGVEHRMRFGGAVRGDAAGVPVAIDLGEVEIDLTGAGRLYRHFDFRRNVQFLTDEAGGLVRRYVYSPFGVAQALGSHPDRRQFAQGAEVGELVLIGARFYEPAAGRFISPDPYFDPINQYAYTLGDPVRFWDPTGALFEQIDRRRAQIVSEWLRNVGLAVLAAGVASGNATATMTGGGMVGVSLVIDLSLAEGDSGPAPDSPAPPLDVGGETAELSGGCSPTSLSRSARPLWPAASLGLLLLVALQLALAALWLRRQGRS